MTPTVATVAYNVTVLGLLFLGQTRLSKLNKISSRIWETHQSLQNSFYHLGHRQVVLNVAAAILSDFWSEAWNEEAWSSQSIVHMLDEDTGGRDQFALCIEIVV